MSACGKGAMAVYIRRLTPVREHFSSSVLQRATNTPVKRVDTGKDGRLLNNLITRDQHQSFGGVHQHIVHHHINLEEEDYYAHRGAQ